MSATETATLGLFEDQIPQPAEVCLTDEDRAEIYSNYLFLKSAPRWDRHGPERTLTPGAAEMFPIPKCLGLWLTPWDEHEGLFLYEPTRAELDSWIEKHGEKNDKGEWVFKKVTYSSPKVGRTSDKTRSPQGEIPPEIEAAVGDYFKQGKTLRRVAVLKRRLEKTESEFDLSLLRTLYGLGFLNKPLHRSVPDSKCEVRVARGSGEIGGVKKVKRDSGEEWGENEEDTGFYIDDRGTVDHSELNEHVTRLRQDVYRGTREEVAVQIDKYDAIVYDAELQGISIEEWAEENGQDPENLRRAINRRKAMVKTKIEHVCPTGACPEHRCRQGGTVAEDLTHYLNTHSDSEELDDWYRNGGYRVLYQLAGKWRFPRLAAEDDDQADQAFVELYQKTMKEALRQDARKGITPEETTGRVRAAFGAALIEFIEPNPDYVRGVEGGQDGRWCPGSVVLEANC